MNHTDLRFWLLDICLCRRVKITNPNILYKHMYNVSLASAVK